MTKYRILVINPRTSFTKIAVYDDFELHYLNKVMHTEDEMKEFKSINDQHLYRKQIVINELKEAEIELDSITAVVVRGGLIKPVKSGVFEINEALRNDLLNSPIGEDSVNLGGLIATDIAEPLKIKAYTCDPVVVDELEDIARISGHPEFSRKSVFHALNQKAAAKRFAKAFNKEYEDVNLIVAHLGIGISIGAHRKGKVIDVTQVYDGEGPISPKRSGSLPIGDVVRMAFSGKYTQDQMHKMLAGNGGIKAYLGTDNMKEVEERALNGDKLALSLYQAMAYQVSKFIGMMYPVLLGEVDAIILTGGIAHSHFFTNMIIERVNKLAPVHIYPGGDEMESLAFKVLAVLNGEIEVLVYQ